jgi:CBS domain-containing protein
MRTIRDILGAKGPEIWTIGPEQTVFEALSLMAEKDVGALVVVVNGGRVAGILSERDYARKVILRGATSRETLVKDIMTAEVICIQPEQSLEECMALMTRKRIRHLPVVSREKLVGLISIGDVVKATIADQESKIGQLETYIMGG